MRLNGEATRLRSSLVGLAALAGAAVVAAPANAYPPRSCGKFGHTTLYSHLKKGGNHKCPTARKLMAQYVRTHKSPSGYSCSNLSFSIPAYCRSNSNSTRTFFLKR